jgi:hypothetical protein
MAAMTEKALILRTGTSKSAPSRPQSPTGKPGVMVSKILTTGIAR